MRISVNLGISCEGHTNDATIKIDYNIFSGKQKEYHETEGKEFQGTARSAYLPDNDDGRRLLKRLKYAFSHGLIFRNIKYNRSERCNHMGRHPSQDELQNRCLWLARFNFLCQMQQGA